MKEYSIIILCVCLLILPSCHTVKQSPVTKPANSKISNFLEERVDSIFHQYNNAATPGIAVGIVKDGETVFTKGYGIANLEYGIPVSDATVFTLCSVSKQFTVLGLMLLRDEGLLSLDDDIRSYVPELPDYGTTITLRHLANNTSGLRSHLQLLGLKGYIADDMINQQITEDVIFRQMELNFRPGDAYNYSNSGFVLLAKVIERVSGQSYTSFLDDRIFKRLGMNHTFVMDNYQKIVTNKAASYELGADGAFVFAPSNYSYVGASGIYTTIEDFSKWAANFQNIVVSNQQIFSEMNTKGILNNGEESFYALGQIVQEYNGLNRIWHSGSDAGYRSYIGRFPDQNISIVLLTNNATVYAEGEALKVMNLFLEPYFERAENRKTQSNEFVNLTSKKKQEFEGAYLSENYEIIRNVIIENDTLVYIRPDQGGRQSKLLPVSETKFVLGNSDHIYVSFVKNETLEILDRDEVVETYYKYTPKDYTIDELQEFIGRYYSEELETFYNIQIQNGELVIVNARMGTIKLNSVKQDGFLGSSWIFSNLIFERDENSKISGFRVSGQRVKNMLFVKV